MFLTRLISCINTPLYGKNYSPVCFKFFDFLYINCSLVHKIYRNQYSKSTKTLLEIIGNYWKLYNMQPVYSLNILNEIISVITAFIALP